MLEDFFGSPPAVDEAEFSALVNSVDVLAYRADLEQRLDDYEALVAELDALRERIATLTPWAELGVELAAVGRGSYAALTPVRIPVAAAEQLETLLSARWRSSAAGTGRYRRQGGVCRGGFAAGGPRCGGRRVAPGAGRGGGAAPAGQFRRRRPGAREHAQRRAGAPSRGAGRGLRRRGPAPAPGAAGGGRRVRDAGATVWTPAAASSTRAMPR